MPIGSGRARAIAGGVGAACLALSLGAPATRAASSPRARAQDTGRWSIHLPLVLARPSQLPPAPTAPAASSPTAGPPPPTMTAPATATGARPTPAETPASPTAAPPTLAPPTPTDAASRDCGAVPSFHDGRTPSSTLWLAPGGDDAAGDGSRERPWATIQRAARAVRPGGAIRLQPGRYAGGAFVADLAGAPDAPIWLGGDDPNDPPIIAGGGEGVHLSRARFVVVHDVVVEGASGNGLNADDGGAVADDTASHHVTFERVVVRDIGGGGNEDCLKLSGVHDVVVRDSSFRHCGGGGAGSGIDMVGVHGALVARSRFEDLAANAVQAKGGAADIEIRANRMIRAGARAVNMGGSTGYDFFRPPLRTDSPNAEARDVRVVANRIEGSEAAVAFVGCVRCVAAHNTIVDPGRWVIRILQETRSGGGFVFEPARDGVFANNIVVFQAAALRTAVNVGDATAPETFRFAHNLWFARDDVARSAPQLPVPEAGAVVGRDPRLGPDGAIDAASPAARAGTAVEGVVGDLVGTCYGEPPSIGAREAP